MQLTSVSSTKNSGGLQQGSAGIKHC